MLELAICIGADLDLEIAVAAAENKCARDELEAHHIAISALQPSRVIKKSDENIELMLTIERCV